jgi:hypothetical protein
MAVNKFFRAAEPLFPMLNLGCLIDLQTGDYVRGRYGESIMNGGLPYITGIVGRGNSFKTMLEIFFLLVVLARYSSADSVFYETEVSGTVNRIYQLAMQMPELAGLDLQHIARIVYTNVITQRDDKKPNLGDLFFDDLKNMWEEKRKGGKEYTRTLPFIGLSGDLMKNLQATVTGIDSFSQFTTTQIANMHEENKIGDKGNNMDHARDGLIKTQFMMQLPALTGSSGGYVMMTAHVGDAALQDPNSPPMPKLDTMKQREGKLKNVPEKFTFLTNVCWMLWGATPHINERTKAPEWPRSPGEELKGDQDLKIINIKALRLKSGMSGMPFQLILSQSEGILVGLTEFNFMKQHKMGINGLGTERFSLELLPDIQLTRTTIRKIIRESIVMQRAMEISSEIVQLNVLPNYLRLNPKYKCTPAQLRDDLIKMGYDWDLLLNTRGYWIYEEDYVEGQTKPFLSTMDLMRMRAGEYHPYWLDDDKKTILPQKKWRMVVSDAVKKFIEQAASAVPA